MLNQKYRFHSRGGVKFTLKQGKTVRQPKISLVYYQNKLGKERFAVVISKKIFKNAVDRNRVRRRVYETIRVNFGQFQKAQDYVFIIYSRDLRNLPFADLKQMIGNLAQKAR